MSTTTTNIQVKMNYRDYSNRTYKIPYNREDTAESTAATKAAIQAFNTAAADPTSAVAQTFLSDTGATVAEITSATLIETTEEVLYSG